MHQNEDQELQELPIKEYLIILGGSVTRILELQARITLAVEAIETLVRIIGVLFLCFIIGLCIYAVW